jgi:hypothetical protein
MLTHNVLWQVSLSNGETFYEGKGKFQEIADQPSPWQKLLKYIAEKKLVITSLSLYTKLGQHFNLPSSGKNPKFSEFELLEKPIDYLMFRKISRDMDIVDMKVAGSEINGWFTVIEAIYPDHRLQLWVDEKNTNNCWVLVK